jgi:hypothetical protein
MARMARAFTFHRLTPVVGRIDPEGGSSAKPSAPRPDRGLGPDRINLPELEANSVTFGIADDWPPDGTVRGQRRAAKTESGCQEAVSRRSNASVSEAGQASRVNRPARHTRDGID